MRRHEEHSLFSAPSFLALLTQEGLRGQWEKPRFPPRPLDHSLTCRKCGYQSPELRDERKKTKREPCSKVASYVALNASCRMDGINRECLGSVPKPESKGRAHMENDCKEVRLMVAMTVTTTKQHSGFEPRYSWVKLGGCLCSWERRPSPLSNKEVGSHYYLTIIVRLKRYYRCLRGTLGRRLPHSLDHLCS